MITSLVFALNPHALCQNVSASVAVAGLNAVSFASREEGADVTAGVKMNERTAIPNTIVAGKMATNEEACAALIEGMPSKYVTRETGKNVA